MELEAKDQSDMSEKPKPLKLNQNVFFVCIQLSIKSYYTFQTALTFLNRAEDKLILVHIYDPKPNEKQESDKKSYSQSDSKSNDKLDEKSKLEQKIKKLVEKEKIANYKILVKARKKDESVLELIKDIAITEADSPTHLFIGFSDPKQETSYISETNYSKILNLSFLINKLTIPCLMIKNKISRETNPGGKFRWLVFMKSGDNISFYVLIKLMSFVDIAKDEIYGFHIKCEKSDKSEKKGINFDDEREARSVVEAVSEKKQELSFLEKKFHHFLNKMGMPAKHQHFINKENKNGYFLKSDVFRKFYKEENTVKFDFFVVGFNFLNNIKQYYLDPESTLTSDLIYNYNENIFLDHENHEEVDILKKRE